MEHSAEIQAFVQALTEGLKVAFPAALNPTGATGASAQPKPPPFTFQAFKASDGTTVTDYFTRFSWALGLSKIPEDSHAEYARVYMGTELNDALKPLISPKKPEDCNYAEIEKTLREHFDDTKNKYAESIKFRLITQKGDESVPSFALRLKQGAAFCEYDAFLDRMLIEQLLHGLSDRNICDEIITKKPNTFKEAYGIAHALESTHKTGAVMKSPSTTPEAAHTLLSSTQQYKQNKNMTHGGSKPRGQGQYTLQSHSNDTASKQNTKDDSRRPLYCYGCGEQHLRSKCPFLNSDCRFCQKKGHIAKVCKTKQMQNQANHIQHPSDDTQEIDNIIRLSKISEIHATKIMDRKMLSVEIDGVKLDMELDTGAPCGIISSSTLRKIKFTYQLHPTNRQFASYTHHRLNCIGRIPVDVTVGNTTRRLDLYVIEGEYDSLFGREWLAQFVSEIDLTKIFTPLEVHNLTTTSPTLTRNQVSRLETLLIRYDNIFSSIAGKLSGPPIRMHLKPGATPVFARAREIPYALRDAYAKEIDAKIEAGYYVRVEHSEWASTTHVVTRKNGKIRITGNYKTTLNPKLICDEHPIPKPEHIFNRMKGSKIFCHLDITDAYTHLVVDEEFSEALTLNTPTHGLIRPTRAVYGAANIPAIWQRNIETVIKDIPSVLNFFDDLLIFSDSFDNLLLTLDVVLSRLKLHGIHLNRSKCTFAASAVEFLGHKIDAEGIHKSDRHIETIRDAPKPKTPDELELFLGKATYYNSFIPDLATTARPLRDMLLQEPFKWTKDADRAYTVLKNILISPQVLIPYDPTLPLVLATDASQVGLGAVLSHRLPNDTERPIAYASRTMTSTEQKYPQIDKEALAIVWACQKFFYYLYARHFFLITDHKPLTQILHPEKSLPVLCISRMANYADYLAHFNYTVEFRNTKDHANADYCSRAPLKKQEDIHKISSREEEGIMDLDEMDVFILRQVDQLPVRAERVATETRKDRDLGKIVQILQNGQNLERNGYKAPEKNYSLSSGCLLFEHRVVIPASLRPAILKDLHAAHVGITKMKGIARSFVYWPGIDAEIEGIANSCTECAKHAHAPAKFQTHHWEYPKGPWERIHIDYAGPVADTMLLVIVDAYSKWVEVKTTNTSTSTATIAMLDELFAAYGSPITVVSDNGRQFVSEEFDTFLKMHGVKYHKLTAPYHPATNGQAERYVGTVKDALNKMETTKSSLRQDINGFLRQYRKAPHCTTGQSPAQLFLGRSIRTRLDLVRPENVQDRMTEKQHSEFVPNFRRFQRGQSIYFLSNNSRMDKWLPGIISARLGDIHYEIQFDGKTYKRHIDQIRSFRPSEPQNQNESQANEPERTHRRFYLHERDDPPMTQPQIPLEEPPQQLQQNPVPSAPVQPPPGSKDNPLLPDLRRSKRDRRPTDFYTPT